MLIAIFAVMVVLGSVMWLRPSPAQQRQAQFRVLARQLGLDVRLAPLPQTRRARVRQEAAEPGVVYRLLKFDLKFALAGDYVLVRERSGERTWEPVTEQDLPAPLRQVLEEVAAEVPAEVAAIELTPQGPGFYWVERGDAATVRKLAGLLERLTQALR